MDTRAKYNIGDEVWARVTMRAKVLSCSTECGDIAYHLKFGDGHTARLSEKYILRKYQPYHAYRHKV